MKLTKVKCVLSLILFSLVNLSYAGSAEDLAILLNSIHSMRAAFTQTTYDNKNTPIQKSVGSMVLQRPGKFRWEVKKPIPQVIIANQTRLWIYDPDLEQVTIRSLKSVAGETPALLLSHVDATLGNDFVVQQKKSADWRWFSLKPKNSDDTFSDIQMGFLHGQIQEMRLQDHLGHLTRIQFQKIETNVNLKSALFVFRAPPHTDVINEAH